MELSGEFSVSTARLELLKKFSSARRNDSGTQEVANDRRLSLYIEDDPFSSKDASIKKVTSFVKKLRQISADQVSTLAREAEGLSLTMHIQEVVASLLDNKPKNSSDIFAVLLVVAGLHQLLPGFLKSFIPELWKPIKSFVASPEPTDRSQMSRFRWLFRAAIELHLAKSYTGLSQITSSLQALLLSKEEQAVKLLPLATYMAKNFPELIRPSEADSPKSCPESLAPLCDIFTQYSKLMCRCYMHTHEQYAKKISRERHHYEHKGDLHESQVTELRQLTDQYESLQKSLEVFCAAFGCEMPQVGAVETGFDVIDGRIVFSSNVPSNADPTTAGPFWDEDERSFYEQLPTIDGVEWRCAAEEENDTEVFDVGEEDPEKLLAEASLNPTTSKLRLFLKNFEKIRGTEELDSLCRAFAAQFGPSFARISIPYIFELARERNDLIHFIARFVASLRSVFHDALGEIEKSLCGQFYFLTKRPEPLFRSRRRVCKLIGEFTKFRVISQSSAYFCLKKCVFDFNGYNIDLLCFLLDSCGRFLYHQAQSHKRLVNIIEIVLKKQGSNMNITVERQNALSNAIYLLNPVATNSLLVTLPDQKQLFVQFLLAKAIDEPKLGRSVFNDSFPWDDTVIVGYLRSELLQPWRYGDHKLASIIELLMDLQKLRSEFFNSTLDILVDLCLAALENVRHSEKQQMLSRCRLLARLLLQPSVEEGMLWEIVFSITIQGMKNQEISSDHSHILRCYSICMFLQAMASVPPAGKRSRFQDCMAELIALFQVYLSNQADLPAELIDAVFDICEELDMQLLLSHEAALESLSQFGIYERVKGLFRDEPQGSSKKVAAPGGSCETAEQLDETVYRDELDREMARLVNAGLEARKLERRPALFDEAAPRMPSESNGTGLQILLKRGAKKRPVLKGLNEANVSASGTGQGGGEARRTEPEKRTFLLQSLRNSDYNSYLHS